MALTISMTNTLSEVDTPESLVSRAKVVSKSGVSWHEFLAVCGELRDAREERDAQKATLQNLAAQLDELRNANNDDVLGNELAKLKAEKEKLQTEPARLQNELTATKKELSIVLASQAHDTKSKEMAHAADRDAIVKQLQAARSDADAKSELLLAAQAREVALQAASDRLKEEFQACKSERDTMAQRLLQSSHRLEEMEQEMKMTHARGEASYSQLQQTRDALQRDMDAQCEMLCVVKQRAAGAEAEGKRLAADVETRNAEVAKLRSDLRLLQNTVADRDAANQKLEATVRSQREALESQGATLQDARAAQASLAALHAGSQEENSALTATVRSREAELEVAAARHGALTEDRDQLALENRRMRQDIDDISAGIHIRCTACARAFKEHALSEASTAVPSPASSRPESPRPRLSPLSSRPGSARPSPLSMLEPVRPSAAPPARSPRAKVDEATRLRASEIRNLVWNSSD